MNFISKKSFFVLLFIILSSLFVRTVFLNEAAIGLNHDEVTFVANAKAVALTGKDLAGEWSPLSLKPIPYGYPMSELPFLIVSPLLGILQSSPFAARLPYALFSVSLVFVLYLITLKLFGEKEANIVGLVAAFNPWGIMFGRTAFDSPLAVFFYMLALLILLHLKNWKILLTFIPLFIAFFSYIGTKIILVPFVIIISYFAWILNKKKYLKYYLLLCFASIILTGVFVISLKTQTTGERIGEIATPFASSVAKSVNEERSLSIPTPLSPIFSNKLVFFSKDFLLRYIGIFSPTYLFFYGDGDMHLSLWFHGYFYYLDLVFLLIGFYVLFQRNKKYWLIFTCLMLIAPLPAAFYMGTAVYVTRGVLIFPLFMILIGLGISLFIDLFKKRMRIFVILVLLFIYLFLFLNFVNIYLFRFPIYNSEGPDFSSRLMSEYISLASENKKVLVFTNEPDALYKDYLFYANAYKIENALEVAKHFQDRKFFLNNVYFKTGCPSDLDLSGKNPIVVGVSSGCTSGKVSNTDYVIIPQIKDAVPVYKIYFDFMCKQYSLKQRVSDINFFDFNIEKLSVRKFCQTFILSRP